VSSELKLIHGSQPSLPHLTRTRPLKIRGEVTFSKRLQSSTEHYEEKALPESLLRRLRKLDAEQLHIITIVAAAIERGAR
jgi:hypothetical protein